MDNHAFNVFASASTDSDVLVVPDCAGVDEHTMTNALLSTVQDAPGGGDDGDGDGDGAGSSSSSGGLDPEQAEILARMGITYSSKPQRRGLATLELGHCGRGFSDRVVRTLVGHHHHNHHAGESGAGAGAAASSSAAAAASTHNEAVPFALRLNPFVALQRLSLAGTYALSDAGLVMVLQSCPGLTSLSILGAPMLKGGFISQLPKLCPLLQEFAISACPSIGDKELCGSVLMDIDGNGSGAGGKAKKKKSKQPVIIDLDGDDDSAGIADEDDDMQQAIAMSLQQQSSSSSNSSAGAVASSASSSAPAAAASSAAASSSAAAPRSGGQQTRSALASAISGLPNGGLLQLPNLHSLKVSQQPNVTDAFMMWLLLGNQAVVIAGGGAGGSAGAHAASAAVIEIDSEGMMDGDGGAEAAAASSSSAAAPAGATAVDAAIPLPIRLESILIDRCPQVTDLTCAGIAAHAQSLRSLTIDSIPKITSEGVDAMAHAIQSAHNRPFTTSTSSVQAGAQDSYGDAAAVSGFGDELPYLGVSGLSGFSTYPSSFAGASASSSFGSSSAAHPSSSTASSNIVSSITDLTIRRCANISSDVLLALVVAASQGQKLATVTLCGLSSLNDAAMVALARHASTTLRDLDVSMCRGITDAGVGTVADTCPNLRKLVVWGCTQLTGIFFLGHKRARMPDPYGYLPGTGAATGTGSSSSSSAGNVTGASASVAATSKSVSSAAASSGTMVPALGRTTHLAVAKSAAVAASATKSSSSPAGGASSSAAVGSNTKPKPVVSFAAGDSDDDDSDGGGAVVVSKQLKALAPTSGKGRKSAPQEKSGATAAAGVDGALSSTSHGGSAARSVAGRGSSAAVAEIERSSSPAQPIAEAIDLSIDVSADVAYAEAAKHALQPSSLALSGLGSWDASSSSTSAAVVSTTSALTPAASPTTATPTVAAMTIGSSPSSSEPAVGGAGATSSSAAAAQAATDAEIAGWAELRIYGRPGDVMPAPTF